MAHLYIIYITKYKYKKGYFFGILFTEFILNKYTHGLSIYNIIGKFLSNYISQISIFHI
jgi:hypothetical protein